MKLYPFHSGDLHCLKCDSSEIDMRYRDDSDGERLVLACMSCSYVWNMACKDRLNGPAVNPIPWRMEPRDTGDYRKEPEPATAINEMPESVALPKPRGRRARR